MKAVLSVLKHKETLIAEAPTGIGKTISTLYPAVKWLPHAEGGKIFYATAKLATREVADKALSDMRQCGLVLKSILLFPKEGMCTAGEDFCDSRFCPYADGYYSRLNAALEELHGLDTIYPEDIRRTAQKHRICAHELQLDASNMCDVIICDYNHVFHPRIHLQRYFVASEFCHTILIDEAHNMISRSRDMFSAPFSRNRANSQIGMVGYFCTRAVPKCIRRKKGPVLGPFATFMHNDANFAKKCQTPRVARSESFEP